MITLEKGKSEGINSQEIRSEEKQNYVQQKDENERLIQPLESIERIQKGKNYNEYEEREKAFEEAWAAVWREDRECEKVEKDISLITLLSYHSFHFRLVLSVLHTCACSAETSKERMGRCYAKTYQIRGRKRL